MQTRQSRTSRLRFPLAGFLAASSFLVQLDGQQISAVVSAANNQPTISPNSLGTIFGTGLAKGTASAQPDSSGSLPTAIGGTSVSIGGHTAQLIYVSPQQINFLVPSDTPLGPTTVTVKLADTSSPASGSVSVTSVSPGLFTIPCLRPSRGAVLNGVTYALEPFQTITSQNAIPDKRTRLSLFGTGLRHAGNAALDSSIVDVGNAITVRATDSLGGARTLPVEYAGPAPKFSGLDQVNVVVPAELEGAGLVSLQLFAGNAGSNPVSIVMSPALAAGLGSGQDFNIATAAGAGAPLQNPKGVALDNQHHLYVASGAEHVVRMVAADGTITTVAGTGTAGSSGDGGPATQAQLRTPTSLAVDASGNLYIADAQDNKIRRIAPDGIIGTFAGTGVQGFSDDGGPAAAALLSSPSAVAVDPYGALVIADTGNNRIRRVTSDGIIDTIAGSGTTRFSGDGGAAYLAGLSAPDTVAVGADGTTYIADEGNLRIRRITADGGISSLLANDLTPISFQSPIRLAVDGNQQLLVSESQNARIQVVNSACQLSTVAGTGTVGFAGDGGPAVNANLNGPSTLVPDAFGDIFFADSNNNRIRRLFQGGCGSPATIVFNPTPAMAGMTVNGLIRLACPAAQASALALSSDTSGLNLPAPVNIAAGETSGSFSFQAPSVDMATGFHVTASNPALSATGTLFVSPSGTEASNNLSMGVAPSPQTAGGPVTGHILLASPAPHGGAQVSLVSSNPAVQVAKSAMVPQGQIAAEFAVGTSPVTKPTSATITGSSIEGSSATSLSLLPASGGNLSTISGLSIAPSPVPSGGSATGTVALASPAADGGVQVGLSSDNRAVSVPDSVTIPAGQSTETFSVSTSPASSPTTATITASSANAVSATLAVSGAPSDTGGTLGSISSLSISPSSVSGGQGATGTVTLASPAATGGVPVSLSSSNAAVTVPASVVIPAGQSMGTFSVSTSAVSSPVTATVTASSANTASAMLTVNPSSGGNTASIASLSISPSSVSGGQGATGTVTLASPAATGGVPVSLSSSNAAVTVPASVVIPVGQSSGTFPVSTSAVSSTTMATVTASSANTASATVTVNPAPPACVGDVTFSKSQVVGGNSVNGTVSLTEPAPATGQPVSLSSSSASASVPAQVTVPPGQTSTGFAVSTTPVLSTQNSVISATTGACAGSSSQLTILPVSLP
jgi:trimeric autotransporter adhesin